MARCSSSMLMALNLMEGFDVGERWRVVIIAVMTASAS